MSAEKINPLVELLRFGQSVWYDNISRELIRSGELARMIAEDGLRGVTSNPTIFEKAITGSGIYKQEVQDLLCEGKTTAEIYEALAVEDIQAAADALRAVFDESGGADGFVSLEVSPTLAHDTPATVAEARRLHGRIGRPNVMIKVPATPAGLPAIEQLVAAGISVNVTLIFSLQHYAGVADAYLRGLEARQRAGQPLDAVASVASVFVSRVDTAVDRILAPNPEARDHLGKAGIANAKVIYAKFRELFSGPRFAPLRSRGARVQRPLWASTGVKNPRYSDVMYVEALIGPDTVDTMPPATMSAFRDHGVCAGRLEQDLEGAAWLLSELEQFGVRLDEINDGLQKDGVDSFVASFAQLMKGIETQAEGAVCEIRKASVIRYRPWLGEVYRRMEESRCLPRLWNKDATLWHHQPAHQAIIRNALGWLGVAGVMAGEVDAIDAFAREIRDAFSHVLLLGMGGSSLCAELCRETFGVKEGHPELTVLDTTDPAMIRRCTQRVDPERTLFVVSSKSGTTAESTYLERYFFEQLRQTKGDGTGENFVAITDAGTPLERLARQQGFRRIFLNPKDIGGRFSALSYFGLVPAALLGIDIRALLDSARRMAQRCGAEVAVRDNPGAQLGAIMGELAQHGRDKLTLVLSEPLAALGSWLEQLIAESTGKEGRGIVPINGEDLGSPAAYGRDRLFVSLELPGDSTHAGRLEQLEAAGHPLARITVPGLEDAGGEIFRWELATAVAGAILGINPFDQPNVQESKDNTNRLLAEYRITRTLPPAAPAPLSAAAAFLAQAREFDYVAILAYVDRSPAHRAALERIRLRIRDRYRLATTVGFGPRFLHSTGQLHKGGANHGLFLQITGDDSSDLPIPGEPFSFGTLKQAQALGDLESLRRHQRRVLHVHIGADVEHGLAELLQYVA